MAPTMRNVLSMLISGLLLGVCSCGGGMQQQTEGAAGGAAGEHAAAFAYPETATVEASDSLWGVDVPDPYRWLENAEDPAVQAWMTAQDELTRGYLGTLERRAALAERIEQLIYVDSISAPTRRGDRYFFERRLADQEKGIYYWREGDGPEQVLLDPNTLSEDGSVSVGGISPSWDGKVVAWSRHENNADEATLYLRDVQTGADSELDVVEGAKYAWPSWTPDSTGFYYTYLPTDPTIPTADRPGYADVRFHQMGTPQSEDTVVFEATHDPTRFLGAGLSRDGRWLMLYHYFGWSSTDVYLKDLSVEGSTFEPLVTGVDALYDVLHWEGQFYIVTNEGAPRFRVFKADDSAPAREHWRELVPESPEAVIEATQLIGGHLVLTTMKDAYNQLEVRDLEGKLVRQVELPGIGATDGMTGLPEHDEAYFGFQSFTVPPRIYETSIATGSVSLWAEVQVPIDPTPYSVEQVWYPSRDGTKVSMFVVRAKDAPRDGTAPMLLYGYGGFNVSLKPSFRATLYAWLEAGGSYAVANLRGGGEYGEEWHRAGMREQKQNVFDDFIAAAEFLLAEGYTSSARLAIQGGSNGGLLVGAVTVQRPELFRAVICAVPLLDMVRYHKFGSGMTWTREYGSSDESQAMFEAILAYSPYQHVDPEAAYPATLFLSADSDDRVDPLHARKMAARMQAANGAKTPILLAIERNAGHGGADLRRQTVEKTADVYAFLIAQLGM